MALGINELASKTLRTTLSLLSILACLTSCSQPKVAVKRIFVAKGNVSFDLPSNVVGYKPFKLFAPCLPVDEEYVPTVDYFFNSDKTITVSLHISPYMDEIRGHIFDEESQVQETKTSDSTAVVDKIFNNGRVDTIEIDYRFTRNAQQYYEKALAIQGRFRTLQFHLRAPDNKRMRSEIEAIRESIRIKPTYLTERTVIESN